MEYLDFEVRVSAASDGHYTVDVVSPAGSATASMRPPFDGTSREHRLQGVELAVVRSAARTRDIKLGVGTRDPVVEFGTQLFDALFGEHAKEKLRRSQDRARAEGKGLRIRLRIDAPELASLPWEFLYDSAGGDYVGLSTDSPLVRYMESERLVEALAVQPPIRVLAMIASPADRPRLDVEHERAQIEQATAGLRAAGTLHLDWLEGSSWRELQRTLRVSDYHVFHFIGHGGFDASADEGVLAFTNDAGGTQLMSAKDVGRLLADENTLRLVVLNACLGARGSDTNVFSSTASALVRRGVPAVVAMQYEISDGAAIEFSRVLYESIADGWPIDGAVAEARKAVSMSVRNSLEWGAPVLHMRSPDGALFRLDRVAQVAPPSAQAGRQFVAEPPPAAAQETIATPLPLASAAVMPANRRWWPWAAGAAAGVVLLGMLIGGGEDPATDVAADEFGATDAAAVEAVAATAPVVENANTNAASPPASPPAKAAVTFMNRSARTIVELQYRVPGSEEWTPILSHGARIAANENYPVSFEDLGYPVGFKLVLDDGSQHEQSFSELAAETMLSVQYDEQGGTLVLQAL